MAFNNEDSENETNKKSSKKVGRLRLKTHPTSSTTNSKREESFDKRKRNEENEEKSPRNLKEIKVEKSEESSSRRKENISETNFETSQKVEERENPSNLPSLKPNFELSGNLLQDTNKVAGIVLKYSEPSEAALPDIQWRLYPFKGKESFDYLNISKQSAYLFGRERKICDIPIDHPSCSKQHAVLQFRRVVKANNRMKDERTPRKSVEPYLIDLESTNGTKINQIRIEPKRYYELKEKDVIQFGLSQREYVLISNLDK